MNEKIIEKIKKLLSRAEGNSNEHEAKVCILKAQKLMAEYNISMLQIDCKDDVDDIIEGNIGNVGRTTWWEKNLSVIISKNFKVYVYLKQYHRGTQISFLGRETDVNIAMISFEFTEKAIKRLSKAYMAKHRGGVGIKNDYIRGFLQGLKEQFEEQVNKNEWGLVLVVDKDVTDVYNKKNLKKTQTSRVRTSNNNHAINEGYKTGKSFIITNGYIN
jgi:hypothetical protein